MKLARRRSLMTQFALLLLMLLAVLAVAMAVVGRSLVVSQKLNEGRSVADMAEHIGKWAAQYGGVSVRIAKDTGSTPGTFLERRVYGLTEEEIGIARSVGTDPFFLVQEKNRDRIETYYSKNPALVQREVSDIAVGSTAQAKFRITAKTVLNPANAPTGFEVEALNAISATGAKEYSRVEGNQLLYARALVASRSCLRCHGTPENSPGFMKTNTTFNGGGGFGYVEGKPAGIISVSIPLPDTAGALASGLTAEGWAALAAVVLMSAVVLLFVTLRVIVPLNRVRAYAEALSTTAVSSSFQVPRLLDIDPASANEIDRLSLAVAKLGESVRVLFGKVVQARR